MKYRLFQQHILRIATVVWLLTAIANAESAPFKLTITQTPAAFAPALHSFSYGRRGDQILILGGRTNGFHRTSQAERTFPSAMANQTIYVVDFKKRRVWKAPLPAPHVYRLRATNTAFFQDGNILYIAGGYGSTTNNDNPADYQTFPTLTAIDINGLANAVVAGAPSAMPGCITSVDREDMRVAGGELKKLRTSFYLIFGQNYDAKYQGGHVGQYTGEVRKFDISYNGTSLSIHNLEHFPDPAGPGPQSEFHRRDLNAVEAVRPDGSAGLTVYGGVFTPNGYAWRHPIYIDAPAGQPTVDNTFQQKMSQYDCATMLMYDTTSRTMFTTLFGGISYYYRDSMGNLAPSDPPRLGMPFVDTIVTLIRTVNGATQEYVHPVAERLPALLGTNAIFVSASDVPLASGSIIAFHQLPKGSTHLGWLYGGIRASAAQANEMNPTWANDKVFDVFIDIP